MQCSAVVFSVGQCRAVQFSAVKCSTVQCIEVKYNAVQCRCSTLCHPARVARGSTIETTKCGEISCVASLYFSEL